jgi:hypothetical protein
MGRVEKAISRRVRRSVPDSVYRIYVRYFGSLRARERFGFLKRPAYAYGLLKAADLAKYFDKTQVTVCEFGVAAGDGLLNMVALAEQITRETGVAFRIFGFDTGKGIPVLLNSYKEHPELWSEGDFPMATDELIEKLAGRAELILGDIRETVSDFSARLDPAAPIGFMSIDVDIYSSAKSALQCLTKGPELYNPAVSLYLDDVGNFFANRWCGELAAIDEFNAENPLRKIDADRSLHGRRPAFNEDWIPKMYVCHVFDHESRTRPDPRRRIKSRTGGNFPAGLLN